VWSGVTQAELSELVQASLQERLQEVGAERRYQGKAPSPLSPIDLLSGDVKPVVPRSPPPQEWKYQSLSEELCAHLKSALEPLSADHAHIHPPAHRPGGIASSDDVLTLQAMLNTLLAKPVGTFIPGVFCPATLEALKEFQSKMGLEPTGFVSDRTWTNLAEQMEVRRKREEEKQLKREEAKVKAKQVSPFDNVIFIF
jgi:murein L,D-transpeptidase YcbB/YkuD